MRSRTLPAEDVRPARLILLLVEGKSYSAIRHVLGCNPNYISRWKGLRNGWNHATDKVWSRIEPELWERTHNPWVVLQTASRTKLEALGRNAEFHERVFTASVLFRCLRVASFLAS